ncbi:unnamed protein product [Boreogadus saida]
MIDETFHLTVKPLECDRDTLMPPSGSLPRFIQLLLDLSVKGSDARDDTCRSRRDQSMSGPRVPACSHLIALGPASDDLLASCSIEDPSLAASDMQPDSKLPDATSIKLLCVKAQTHVKTWGKVKVLPSRESGRDKAEKYRVQDG